MTLLQILIVGTVVLITHAIEAVTGFGCTVLALPFVTAVLGVKVGVPLLAVLGWALALYIVITKWRKIVFREYGIIVLFVGLGMPLGMYAFRSFDPALLKRILAVFIIVISGWRILRSSVPSKTESSGKSPVKLPKLVAYTLLFLGGIIHGAFASGGPLVVLYAASALPDKGNFRATLCMLWTTVNTVLIISYAQAGVFIPEFNTGLAVMLPFLLTGIIAGEKIHDHVHPSHFEQIIFGVLGVTGIVMLILA